MRRFDRPIPSYLLAILFAIFFTPFWNFSATISEELGWVPHIMKTSLSAQKVYTDLIQVDQVHKFTEVSHSMVCQCGCGFVLNVCPHTECPWGIPVRRLIEHLILSGLSIEEILDRFHNGFGPSFPNQSYPKKMAEDGHELLIRSLAQGYGPKITAKSSLLVPYILLIIAVLIGILIAVFWYKRNSLTDSEVPIC